MMKQLFQAIAVACGARKRCLESGNDYAKKWDEKLAEYSDLLPSGSGIDSGCKIDLELSGDEKIVIHTSFHHMDDNGYYCGWSNHDVVVTPSFHGFNLRITGRDVRGIKEYLRDIFHESLNQEI